MTYGTGDSIRSIWVWAPGYLCTPLWTLSNIWIVPHGALAFGQIYEKLPKLPQHHHHHHWSSILVDAMDIYNIYILCILILYLYTTYLILILYYCIHTVYCVLSTSTKNIYKSLSSPLSTLMISSDDWWYNNNMIWYDYDIHII